MDIQRFEQQHIEILRGIAELRELSKRGTREHADEIAKSLTELARIITLHLAIEDRILYPTLEASGNPELAALSQTFRQAMTSIATPFIAFSRKWSNKTAVSADPEGFRNEANTVLRAVYERMRQEDHEFYPAIKATTIA